jgi:hypothetical protein
MNDDAPELPESSHSPESLPPKSPPPDVWPPEFWKLVEGASDESISPTDAAAFAERLANDPAAQRQYLAHIQLQADIRLHCRAQQSLEKALARLDERSGEIDDQPRALPAPVDALADSPLVPGAQPENLTGFSSTNHLAWAFFGRPPVMGLVFAFTTIAVLWITLGKWPDTKPNEPVAKPVVKRKIPRNVAPEVANQSPRGIAAGGFVARIVQGSDDLEWGNSVEPFDFMLRIKPREKLKVVSGFVQIQFAGGAKFILHGPAVFQPLGYASGRIESGRLTAEVTKGAFRLKTPTTEVVDLGTAFGVAINDSMGTDVVVFDGRVQVYSEPGANGQQEVLDMTEGMSARFRADGTTEFGLKTDAAMFTRKFPASAGSERRDEICLIDVIAGGNGQEACLAGSIAPFNGERDKDPEATEADEHGLDENDWMHMSHLSDGQFHLVPSSPLLNGVFIPTESGRQVQVDSAGRKIDLPQNSGFCFGTLWARRKESIQNLKSGPAFDFWGFRTLEGIVEKLNTTRNGLVGMHANMGVTFDLRTVQMIHRRAPVEFRGAVSNIENFAVWPPGESPSNPKTRLLDCRIYVDGELQYSRLGFRREDGDEKFSVPLSGKNRFLTIVMTDSDTEFRYDHGVLIDPVIVLDKE